jgi:hypothetical protein
MVNQKFLDILFDEGEQVCVRPAMSAFQSIPLEDLRSQMVELISNDGEKQIAVPTNTLKLIALNPIKGKLEDAGCTAYRNFLIEMDGSGLGEQWDYVREFALPYSACVFSGGKSLHFAVCLQESLPSEDIYRFYAEWILNIMSQADQSTKNPSRGIRIPDVEREAGKMQKLIDLKDRIPLDTLVSWLNDFKGLQPKMFERVKEYQKDIAYEPTFNSLWYNTKVQLRDGIDASKGRNNGWFKIALDFGLKGFSFDEMVAHLETIYTPERDFRRREWLMAIKSGHNKGRKGRYGGK